MSLSDQEVEKFQKQWSRISRRVIITEGSNPSIYPFNPCNCKVHYFGNGQFVKVCDKCGGAVPCESRAFGRFLEPEE